MLFNNQQPQSEDFFTTLNAHRVPQDTLTAELSQAARTQVPTSFASKFRDASNSLASFCDGQQVQLEVSAKSILGRAQSLATSDRLSAASHTTTLQDLQQSTRRVVEDCIALQDFYANNRNLLLQLAKQADQELVGGTYVESLTTSYHPLLTRAHINSSLVCVVSDLYHALQQIQDKILHGDASGGDLWQAPSSFQRNTTKYWVTNEALTKLMMICAAQAPLLVYGHKGPLTSTWSGKSEGDKLWETLATKITSIYFDSNKMDLYRERLKRAEGAQLLRVRWYGTKMPRGPKPIFVELKTHHERWVAQKSVKERATIHECDMPAFLEPVRWTLEDAEALIQRASSKKKPLTPKELAKQTKLLWRMHNLVVNHKLIPCVRSVYDRAAFQSSKSNDLRLTLDRNVTLVNERVPRSSEGWCLSDEEAKDAASTVVPFNVFEVKLAGSDPMPIGLANAMRDNTIQVATKFSKFLTGAAAFNSVQTLPYWAAHPAFYTFFGMEARIKQSNNLLEETNGDDAYQSMNDNESPSSAMLGSLQLGGVSIAPPNPSRIEPKTFFANERTFVQWISASILLITISGFLTNSAVHSYHVTAAVICVAAMGLVVYSTGLYFKRLNLLKHREPYGYFNKINPIFLTSVVGLTVFLIWADSIKGSDMLAFFSDDYRYDDGDRRFLLRGVGVGAALDLPFSPCDGVVASRSLDFLMFPPSALVVDAHDQHAPSFLVTSGDSIYRQVEDESSLMLSIRDGNLQGLAYAGENRLFAVSNNSQDHAELLELVWWTPRGAKEERLRAVGRWALEHNSVHGLAFVPSSDERTMDGHLYIWGGSSIHIYSVPNDSVAHPLVRRKSLNMKVLTQGHENDDDASTITNMITYEGITYILKHRVDDENLLEAWNLTEGALVSTMNLPAGFGDTTSLAIDRNVEDNALYLHMIGPDSRLWSYRTNENLTTSGAFIVRGCPVTTMN